MGILDRAAWWKKKLPVWADTKPQLDLDTPTIVVDLVLSTSVMSRLATGPRKSILLRGSNGKRYDLHQAVSKPTQSHATPHYFTIFAGYGITPALFSYERHNGTGSESLRQIILIPAFQWLQSSVNSRVQCFSQLYASDMDSIV